jgi:hypothetical protein
MKKLIPFLLLLGGASFGEIIITEKGDEFAVILPKPATAAQLATKLGTDGSNATSDFIDNVTTGVQVTAYAYLTAPSNTVLSTTNWYYFKGVFSNEVTKNVSFGAAGITVDVDCDIEVEWNTSGQSDQTTSIQIAMAKNASFNTNGIMTNGVILNGSFDSQQSDTGSAADGWAGIHSMWQGSLVAGDSLSLIIRTDDASPAVTWAALSASASLHSLVAVGLSTDAPVVQTTGTSTTDVMSQNAVTEAIEVETEARVDADDDLRQIITSGQALSYEFYISTNKYASGAFGYTPTNAQYTFCSAQSPTASSFTYTYTATNTYGYVAFCTNQVFYTNGAGTAFFYDYASENGSGDIAEKVELYAFEVGTTNSIEIGDVAIPLNVTSGTTPVMRLFNIPYIAYSNTNGYYLGIKKKCTAKGSGSTVTQWAGAGYNTHLDLALPSSVLADFYVAKSAITQTVTSDTNTVPSNLAVKAADSNLQAQISGLVSTGGISQAADARYVGPDLQIYGTNGSYRYITDFESAINESPYLYLTNETAFLRRPISVTNSILLSGTNPRFDGGNNLIRMNRYSYTGPSAGFFSIFSATNVVIRNVMLSGIAGDGWSSTNGSCPKPYMLEDLNSSNFLVEACTFQGENQATIGGGVVDFMKAVAGVSSTGPKVIRKSTFVVMDTNLTRRAITFGANHNTNIPPVTYVDCDFVASTNMIAAWAGNMGANFINCRANVYLGTNYAFPGYFNADSNFLAMSSERAKSLVIDGKQDYIAWSGTSATTAQPQNAPTFTTGYDAWGWRSISTFLPTANASIQFASSYPYLSLSNANYSTGSSFASAEVGPLKLADYYAVIELPPSSNTNDPSNAVFYVVQTLRTLKPDGTQGGTSLVRLFTNSTAAALITNFSGTVACTNDTVSYGINRGATSQDVNATGTVIKVHSARYRVY